MPASVWVGFPELPVTERFQYAAVATDDGVFVWGGCCEPGTWTAPDSTAFHDGAYFDMTSGDWRVLPQAPLDPNRGDALAGWNGQEVIVLNGFGTIRAAAFDPISFTWRPIRAPAGDSAASAVSRLYPLPNGHVAFVINNYEDGLGNGVRVQTYDPATDTWTAGTEPRPDLSYGTSQPAAIHGSAVDDTSVAILSSARHECRSAAVDVYDTTTGAWRTFEHLTHPDSDWIPNSIVGIGNRRFLVLGGPCDGQPQRLGLILDTTDGSTTTTANIPVDLRGGFGYDMTWTGNDAIKLNGDGRLLAYNPTSDHWTVSEPIPTASTASEADAVAGVPIVWIDNTVIVPAIATNTANNECCQPERAGWSYRIE